MRMHFMQHQLDQMMIGKLVVLAMIVSELGYLYSNIIHATHLWLCS